MPVGVFEMFGKRNYDHLQEVIKELQKENPDLCRPYDEKLGVFPCRSINEARKDYDCQEDADCCHRRMQGY